MNNTELELGQNFEIGTLSPPSILVFGAIQNLKSSQLPEEFATGCLQMCDAFSSTICTQCTGSVWAHLVELHSCTVAAKEVSVLLTMILSTAKFTQITLE